MWFVVFGFCRQAGAVANQPIINAVNTRMNSAGVASPVHNNVVRPCQSTAIVGNTATNAVQQPMSVIGGRLIMPSTTAVSVPQRAVPANPSAAGTYTAERILGCEMCSCKIEIF